KRMRFGMTGSPQGETGTIPPDEDAKAHFHFSPLEAAFVFGGEGGAKNLLVRPSEHASLGTLTRPSATAVPKRMRFGMTGSPQGETGTI
ncbi:MAG: hypothetical protein ABI648_09165, partial [Betaproteobacteria bacterium]